MDERKAKEFAFRSRMEMDGDMLEAVERRKRNERRSTYLAYHIDRRRHMVSQMPGGARGIAVGEKDIRAMQEEYWTLNKQYYEEGSRTWEGESF